MLMWARTLYSCKLVEDINCPQKINPTSDSLCYVNKGYSVVEFWQRMLLKLYTNADLLPPATAIWPNRSVGHCLAEAETGARGERQGGVEEAITADCRLMKRQKLFTADRENFRFRGTNERANKTDLYSSNSTLLSPMQWQRFQSSISILSTEIGWLVLRMPRSRPRLCSWSLL